MLPFAKLRRRPMGSTVGGKDRRFSFFEGLPCDKGIALDAGQKLSPLLQGGFVVPQDGGKLPVNTETPDDPSSP